MSFVVKRQRAGVRGSRQWSAISFLKQTDISLEHRTEKSWSLHTFHLSFLIILLVLSGTGCNETFQPFQENDRYSFTIYGYLDASADTQWVRVAPARQEFNMSQEIPDLRVTLEHPESGTSSVMNDSMFSSGGFNYLNYWTAMNIEPQQSYRLTAEGSDGEASQVTITTPGELPTPRVLIQQTIGSPDPATYRVYIDDSVEHLVDVQTKWYVRFYSPGFEEKKLFLFSYKSTSVQSPIYGGVYSILLEPAVEEEEIRSELPPGAEMEILRRQIYVASAGPEWNENIETLDDISYALPGAFSNVENGLGYMVGVSSKTIPYASCFNGQNVLVPCEEEDPYW